MQDDTPARENPAARKRERSSSSSTATSTSPVRSRPDVSPRTHSRSMSGSVFARLPFLRSHTSDTPPSSDDVAKNKDLELPVQRSSAMAAALEQQGRKRRGSLRKAAMLGTGLLRRDRSNSNADGNKAGNAKLEQNPTSSAQLSTSLASRLSPRRFTFELPGETSSTEAFPALNQELSIDTASTTVQGSSPTHTTPVTSPILAQETVFASPTSTYLSMTDDDELSTEQQHTIVPPPDPRPICNKPRSLSPSPPSSVHSSHLAIPFSSPPPLPRPLKSTTTTTKSPLATAPPSTSSNVSISLSSSEDWDYTATEWWGWVVLAVTWIVFVVGMGSCLDVWSWAWDVGETPYAPPELEDDPTLPIVGYYPALIVMTAVMSWVWVVVAWVGMKYFKHAKIQGD